MTVDDLSQGLPDVGAPTPYRVRPSIGAAVGLYVGYLGIFFTTWAINDVDYDQIGETVESAKIHYALPTLFASAFLVVAVTALGWWRPALFDKERSGPRWAWIGPIVMIALALSSFLFLGDDNRTASLVLWGVLGAIGVGFGEEMLNRGTLVVALRARYTEEKVWLYSTLAFSAMHIPNIFFGAPAATVLTFQMLNTFVFGSLMWFTRRLSGTLLLPMFIHGLWDTSIFLPRATGSDGNPVQLLVIPVAIVCAIAVLKRNKGLRLG